jgi:hypothetical protein
MFNYNTRRIQFKLVLISALFLVLGYLSIKYLNFVEFDSAYLVLVIWAFSLIVINFFLNYQLFSPLHKVVKEIAALFANSPYNKIKIKLKNEFGLLAYFFNEITKNVENISFYLKEGNRMASELAIARDIQKSVLPSSIPIIPKLDTVAKTRSAEEVGGDSFDISLKGTDYYIYLGDVTGHGAPAGLIMMMVNTLFDVYLPSCTNTYDLTVQINKMLKPRVNSSMFMTASFFRWDTVNEKLYYTGAGHEHILIYRAAEGVTEAIPAGGIALAMAEDVTSIVSEKEVVLSDQDVIVLYSDGITEAVNISGQLLGLEALKTIVNQSGPLGDSLKIFETISGSVQQFVGDAVQKDDMTLLVMRYCKNGFTPDRPENLVSTKWYE